MITRRNILMLLGSVPFLGWLTPKPEKGLIKQVGWIDDSGDKPLLSGWVMESTDSKTPGIVIGPGKDDVLICGWTLDELRAIARKGEAPRFGSSFYYRERNHKHACVISPKSDQ